MRNSHCAAGVVSARRAVCVRSGPFGWIPGHTRTVAWHRGPVRFGLGVSVLMVRGRR